MDAGQNSIENSICEFLAAGESAVETAKLVGISIERIQELLKNESFRELVKARGKELRNQRIEAGYAKTEEHLLKKITDQANDEMIEMGALCRALEVVAKNRVLYRNPAGFGQPTVMNFNQVTLMLPAAAQASERILTNGNSEIVSIGDRNMSGMPIDGVRDIFKSIEDKRANKGKGNATTIDASPTATS